MASYLVLEPGGAAQEKAEKAVFVRDGFAALAFLVPFFWFLWHRMWLEALAALVLGLMLGALGTLLGFSLVAPLIGLLLSVLIGLEAQNLRVAALRRRGWSVWGVVEAGNHNEAEMRYAADVAPLADRPPAAPPTVPAALSAGTGLARGSSFDLLDYPRGG
ncbi:DUF2628 domain-containing protein [Chelativorans salis]|uniref:DUF2628 domain-containing protein n=1 Tax=Chelativorans salis TaxID=2978478 RepID=A0ABT2LP80_9HYPH|nr:DUF2628 domain-containing protein [Chelativorans sp. EGI FJ00035]MCT7376224.1 DUF2628 domain-containing protein [Chelativorans sp. EGI FJ00035]